MNNAHALAQQLGMTEQAVMEAAEGVLNRMLRWTGGGVCVYWYQQRRKPEARGNDMNSRKLDSIISMVRDNINAQRRNAPDSAAATHAREENQRLFALLGSHGVAQSEAMQKAMLA